MKFRVNCDRINCKWNLGKLGPFRGQCKKAEITIINGKCIDFKLREMVYVEQKKGLQKWI